MFSNVQNNNFKSFISILVPPTVSSLQAYHYPGEIRGLTDDDDGCAGQQSEQGEEHHLVAVYEAVQGVPPLDVSNWSSSCTKRAVGKTTGRQNLREKCRDGKTC